ncbi:hypothetical protein L1887_05055 [Cichorium endivia]|nr:hypothetical protein L1887_05055 [Cichorium endivia]
MPSSSNPSFASASESLRKGKIRKNGWQEINSSNNWTEKKRDEFTCLDKGSRRQEGKSPTRERESPAGGEVADRRGSRRQEGVADGSIAQSRSRRREYCAEQEWPAEGMDRGVVAGDCSTLLFDFAVRLRLLG